MKRGRIWLERLVRVSEIWRIKLIKITDQDETKASSLLV
jgi:hypothetical protein